MNIWKSSGQNGSDDRIYAQIYDDKGEKKTEHNSELIHIQMVNRLYHPWLDYLIESLSFVGIVRDTMIVVLESTLRCIIMERNMEQNLELIHIQTVTNMGNMFIA